MSLTASRRRNNNNNCFENILKEEVCAHEVYIFKLKCTHELLEQEMIALMSLKKYYAFLYDYGFYIKQLVMTK